MLYTPFYRPKYHFTPSTRWMNDPNGLVYVDGRYHLYFQHNPYDAKWGPMHWGHATSHDLIHWHHRPMALYPDANGNAYSGSAVTVEKDDKTQIAAIYTSHGDHEQQSLAYSENGEQFTPYSGNPIIPNTTLRDFRDPKIFEDPVNGGWALAVVATDRCLFYHSSDMISWEETGSFGPFEAFSEVVWECPCLVEVPVEGTDQKKWIFLFSLNGVDDKWIHLQDSHERMHDMYYWVGSWNGSTFVPESGPDMVDFARDDYAGATWYGTEKPIYIGWASNWAYANEVPTGTTGGWRGQMTFPRTLSLKETPSGFKLAQKPVVEGKGQMITVLRDGGVYDLGENILAVHVKADGPSEIRLSTGTEVFSCGIDDKNRAYMDRSVKHPIEWSASYEKDAFSYCHADRLDRGTCEWTLYFDRSVAEMYVDGGTRVGTMLVYPEIPFKWLTAYGGEATLFSLNIER